MRLSPQLLAVIAALALASAGATPPLLELFRRACRFLQSSSPSPGLAAKLLRTAAALPLFAWIALSQGLAWALGLSSALRARARDGFETRGRFPELLQTYVHMFGIWEPDVAAHIRRSLGEGDVMADVGANVGFFSLLAAERVGRTGAVVAIDASPAMARLLEENLRANPSGARARVVRAAAGSAPGRAWIHSGPAISRGHASLLPGPALSREAEVEVRPLLELLRDDELARLRLVKIDVEGWEAEVLRGLAGSLERLPPQAEILLELCPRRWPRPRPDVEEILAPFRRAGFRPYRVDNDYWPWRYLWPDAVRVPAPIDGRADPGLWEMSLLLSRRPEGAA